MQSIVTADAESLSDANCGYLKNDTHPMGELNAVYPIEGGTLVRSESFKAYKSIRLKPGTYRVQLKAWPPGYQVAFPIVTVDVRPGKTYLFSSKIVMDGKAVRAFYREVDTSEYTENKK